MSDIPHDETIRVRRSWPGTPPGADAADDGIDETTAVSRRRSSSAAEARPPADPQPPSESSRAPRAMPAATGSTDPHAARPRRSTYVDGPIDTEESTDGSTIVARRESRRRASRESAADGDPGDSAPNRVAAAPGPPSTHPARVARTPDGAPDAFGVRRSQPVISLRRPVPPREPQAPQDGAAADSRRRSEDRRATVIVVGTASVIVVAAASALIALVLSL